MVDWVLREVSSSDPLRCEATGSTEAKAICLQALHIRKLGFQTGEASLAYCANQNHGAEVGSGDGARMKRGI